MSAISPRTKLGHYKILSQLGAGGIGEVYLVYDITLDRKVALKLLPAQLASSADRMRRFVQEAKAAAALNHPNIAHVYEIGDHEGHHFIAMEFIEGNTLADEITRERQDQRSGNSLAQRARARPDVHISASPGNGASAIAQR